MTGDGSLYGFTVGSFDGRFTVSALRNCNASYCCPSFLSKVAKVTVIVSDDLSIFIVIQCLIRDPKADSLWLLESLGYDAREMEACCAIRKERPDHLDDPRQEPCQPVFEEEPASRYCHKHRLCRVP